MLNWQRLELRPFIGSTTPKRLHPVPPSGPQYPPVLAWPRRGQPAAYRGSQNGAEETQITRQLTQYDAGTRESTNTEITEMTRTARERIDLVTVSDRQ